MIYILISHTYEGYNFIGAFSTREKAEEAQATYNADIIKQAKETWDYEVENDLPHLQEDYEKYIEFVLEWDGANTILETELDTKIDEITPE